MADVQPRNVQSGYAQNFHANGEVILNPNDVVGTTNTQMGFSDDGRLRISGDQPTIWDSVEGATLNTNIWGTTLSTMTVTQGGGFITLNAGLSVVAGAYAILTSNKSAYKLPGQTWFAQAVIGWLPANQSALSAGSVYEWGMANFSGVVVNVSDGVFLRASAGGDMYIVQSFNGQEDSTELVFADNGLSFVPNPGDFYLAELSITDEHIHIELVNIGTSLEDPGELTTVSQTVTFLSTRPGSFSVSHLPIAARIYNLVAPAVAPSFFISNPELSMLDSICVRTYAESLCANQRGSHQGINATQTFVQTGNHANSTSPTSAALSNTVAGYTTLGGRYQFAAPAGAATDYLIFAYQIPTGVDFICKGIKISAMNTGAAVATTATILDWFIAVQSSAVSLATAEGAGTWAPRRIDLGLQGFIVGAGIGVAANDIYIPFPDGLPTNGARFFMVGVQVPVGTATAGQIIRGDVTIVGYQD